MTRQPEQFDKQLRSMVNSVALQQYAAPGRRCQQHNAISR